MAAAKQDAFNAFAATPRVLDADANGVPVIRDRFGTHSYLLCIENVGRALVTDRSAASGR